MSDGIETTRAELRSFFAVDARDGDLSTYEPPDPMNSGLHVMAFITSLGAEHADSFDFTVCSPRWLADRYEEGSSTPQLSCPAVTWSGDLLFGAGFLHLAPWDYAALETSVRSICDEQAGPDWGAVASRIGRLLPWEFAYRYDFHVDGQLSASFPDPDGSPSAGRPES